ncbi:hypothetical protein PR048_007247 [Dryococelus australis]|uniref:Uncharacterized protein n=1 Tax=Dryococelus australis TaxID=614101 RepID=A0ABQ9ID47_9NEOP|nr:hypothetical protein PR048_007247 [Dryococelus australis]
MDPRVQGQEARGRYGRQLRSHLAPHRPYAQDVQCLRPNAELGQTTRLPPPKTYWFRFPAGAAPEFSHVGIVQDDTAGRRGFLGDLPLPHPPLHSCDKIGVPHVYTEVTFAIVSQLIIDVLDVSGPIGDLQGKKYECHTARGGGGVIMAERLSGSPLTRAIRVQSPDGPLQILACRNHPGRCRWSAGLLRDRPFPLPLHTSITLICSQVLDVKSRPNLFTSLHCISTVSNSVHGDKFKSLLLQRRQRQTGEAVLLMWSYQFCHWVSETLTKGLESDWFPACCDTIPVGWHTIDSNAIYTPRPLSLPSLAAGVVSGFDGGTQYSVTPTFCLRDLLNYTWLGPTAVKCRKCTRVSSLACPEIIPLVRPQSLSGKRGKCFQRRHVAYPPFNSLFSPARSSVATPLTSLESPCRRSLKKSPKYVRSRANCFPYFLFVPIELRSSPYLAHIPNTNYPFSAPVLLQSRRGRGGVVVRLLASDHSEPGSIPGGVTPWIFACGNRTERCRLSAGFYRGSPVSPRHCIPVLLHTHLASPSAALKTSTLRAVKFSSLTHSSPVAA